MNKTLFLFHSAYDVMRAERLCIQNTLAVHVVPVPREVSSECGMALEIGSVLAPQVASLLKKHRIKTHLA